MSTINSQLTNQVALPGHAAGRWRALALLSLAELLGMSLWFSASAVVPALRVEWFLSDSSAGWLTIAVQLGFVVGTLLSAFLNLPDVLRVRYLFDASALFGALANAAFAPTHMMPKPESCSDSLRECFSLGFTHRA